jgi:hypothetical protein
MFPVGDSNLLLPSEFETVKLYVSNSNPEYLDIKHMHPCMIAEAPVSETIQPVLDALAESYSPVRGL